MTATDAPPWEQEAMATGWPIYPIKWAEFWTTKVADPEFVIEPLFAAGRQTAIYSTAKTGKSLLVLDMVAAAVTGRSVLGQVPRPKVRVVYLDFEMTESDLRERLSDLGYGPGDDLDGLAYYQLPSLPPLNTDLGGLVLSEAAAAHGAELVIVDTMARVVSGKENDADTYRDFYRYTGLRLKAQGVALGRLDHAGKDGGLGQRGSSAKDDDVDTVYRMTAADLETITLKRTHSRVPWMADEIFIARQDEPNLRHVIATEAWPAGTKEVADLLDELSIPLDATSSSASAALKRAGNGKRKTVILAALKFRRNRP